MFAKLMRADPRRSPTGRVDGNLDRITDIVRGLLAAPDLTTSDVLDFFTSHERPSLEAARKIAGAHLSDDEGDSTAHRLVTVGSVTSRGLTIPRPVHVTSIEHIGREVSRSVVEAFLNQGTIPHQSTIARIEAAVERHGASLVSAVWGNR